MGLFHTLVDVRNHLLLVTPLEDIQIMDHTTNPTGIFKIPSP